MGGHQARKLALPGSAEITKVEVAHPAGDYGGHLDGLRMYLSNGKAMGALNRGSGSGTAVTALVPPPGHKIIGFYGRSGKWGMCHEFGIVCAPNNVELPDSMYDMPELQNTNGGTAPRGVKVSFLEV